MNDALIDKPVVDETGSEIGTVTDVVVDPRTLEPDLVTVKLGRFSKDHWVPVQVLEHRGDQVLVHCDKEAVKAAPTTKSHIAPTATEREELFAHYGLPAPT